MKKQEEFLNTDILPEYNCSNCDYFLFKNTEILHLKGTDGVYAVECENVVHPIEDCILRGFKAHSKQPGFSQTLNEK